MILVTENGTLLWIQLNYIETWRLAKNLIEIIRQIKPFLTIPNKIRWQTSLYFLMVARDTNLVRIIQ